MRHGRSEPRSVRRLPGPLHLVAAPLLTVAVLLGSSCGGGQPAYCDDLRRSADMTALNAALRSQDLGKARTAADEFRDLADGAPDDVRSDMRDLAAAVGDIVDLIGQERSATAGAHGTEAGGSAAGVDQRRGELNTRLGELAAVSSRVERWAQRNCGLSLR